MDGAIEGWRRECGDADDLLRHLGLDPAQCRTDGGWLNLPRIKALLADAGVRVRRVADGQRWVYLSGPMTGLPELNFPAFHEAAARLRGQGLTVVNPAEINPGADKSWHACMRADIKALCDCDAIALLPGWQRSDGAHLELHVGHRIGLEVGFV